MNIRKTVARMAENKVAKTGEVRHWKSGDFQKGADKKWHEKTSPAVVANLVGLMHAGDVMDAHAVPMSEPHRKQLIIRYHKNHRNLNQIYKDLCGAAGIAVKPGISRSLSTKTKGKGLSDEAFLELADVLQTVAKKSPDTLGTHPEIAKSIADWGDDPKSVAKLLAALHAHDPEGDPKLQHMAGLVVRRLTKLPGVQRAVASIKATGAAKGKLDALTATREPVVRTKGGVTPESRPELFTTGGHRLSRPTGPNDQLNPAWDSTKPDEQPYAFYIDPADRKRKSLWTLAHRTHSLHQKFEAIQKKVIPIISAARKHIARDMGVDSQKELSALLLWVIDRTWARVGTSDVADDRGMSLVLRSQCRITGDTATFSYSGKKGVKQRHEIEFDGTANDAKAKKCLVTLRKRFPDSAYLFSDTRNVKVQLTAVSDYMKSIGLPSKEDGFGVHGFRSLNATVTANHVLNESPSLNDSPTPHQAERYIIKSLLEIDQKLGHKSAKGGKVSADLYSYVDPRVIATYKRKHKIDFKNPHESMYDTGSEVSEIADSDRAEHEREYLTRIATAPEVMDILAVWSGICDISGSDDSDVDESMMQYVLHRIASGDNPKRYTALMLDDEITGLAKL